MYNVIIISVFFLLATGVTLFAIYANKHDKHTPFKVTNATDKPSHLTKLCLVLCWTAVILTALFLLETAVGLWFDDNPQLSGVLFIFVFTLFIPLTWIVCGLYAFALLRAFARFTRADGKLLWGHAVNIWLLFIIILIGIQGGEKGGFNEMKENYSRCRHEMQALTADIQHMFPDSVNVRLIFDWRGRMYDLTVSTADSDSILYQSGTCRANTMEDRRPEYLSAVRIDSLYTKLKQVDCYGLKTNFGEKKCVSLRFARTTYGHYSYKFYALPLKPSELKTLQSEPNIRIISPSVICYHYIGSQRFQEL